MGTPHPPPPTKPVVGIIAADPELGKRIARELPWGTVDLESPVIKFDFTDYYESEMGQGLVRCWFSFDTLVTPDRLAAMKLLTNSLEQRFLDRAGSRRCNLDPGLVSTHNLILATTKPAAHRIYLEDGIYAEVTLTFRNQTFEPLAWTYPDYRTEAARQFFLTVRAKLTSCQNSETPL